MPLYKRSRNSVLRAYTLVELLIVIALLGLASALLIPAVGNLNSMEAQSAVRLIIGDLSYAQSDALAHQEFRRVHFYDDGSGYCIVRVTAADFFDAFDPDTADYITDPLAGDDELGRYIIDFASDDRFREVQITEVEIDGTGGGARRFVTYDALGGTVSSPNIPGSGGRIVVASDDETYEIEMSPFTGKLTVRKVE